MRESMSEACMRLSASCSMRAPTHALTHAHSHCPCLQAWSTDVDQLKLLCDANSACVGFNSNGFLKSSLNTTASPGTVFYIKNPDVVGGATFAE